MYNSLNWPKAWLLTAFITAFNSQAACRDTITPSTPTSRFIVHDNGTVTDTQTDLMWQRCSLGQSWDGNTCRGDAANYTWQAALTAAQSDEFAGMRNWVLPNIKQLMSIVELACYNPAINSSIFPNTPNNFFWTSSPYVDYSAEAWRVGFIYGELTNLNSFLSYVRLVRSGQ
jgi:hypothetical protein